MCEKNAAKKRKTFDSSKQRADGTEIKSVPKTPKSTNKAVRQRSEVRGGIRGITR